MKNIKVSFDTWIQLLGMIGVLGGLVFVGLEMQQSQTIALAAQNQARVAAVSQSVSSATEAGINFLDILGSEPSQDDEYAAVNTLIQAFLFLENDFLQHNLGLMEEEMWEARLAAFTDTLSSCFARKTFEEGKFRIDRRFVELVENRLSVDCESNQ